MLPLQAAAKGRAGASFSFPSLFAHAHFSCFAAFWSRCARRTGTTARRTTSRRCDCATLCSVLAHSSSVFPFTFWLIFPAKIWLSAALPTRARDPARGRLRRRQAPDDREVLRRRVQQVAAAEAHRLPLLLRAPDARAPREPDLLRRAIPRQGCVFVQFLSHVLAFCSHLAHLLAQERSRSTIPTRATSTTSTTATPRRHSLTSRSRCPKAG